MSSEENDPIKLTKRTERETEAYFQGYKAGLLAAKDGISRSIDNFELLRKSAERDVERGIGEN
jgi:hypothetical protein